MIDTVLNNECERHHNLKTNLLNVSECYSLMVQQKYLFFAKVVTYDSISTNNKNNGCR